MNGMQFINDLRKKVYFMEKKKHQLVKVRVPLRYLSIIPTELYFYYVQSLCEYFKYFKTQRRVIFTTQGIHRRKKNNNTNNNI